MIDFFKKYSTTIFTDTFGNFNDEKWLEVIKMSVTNKTIDGIEFPDFPPEEIQTQWVGVAGERGVEHSFPFYKDIKGICADFNKIFHHSDTVLDFGCGWGRHLRYFLKDLPFTNLYGVDPHPGIISFCKRNVKYPNFLLSGYLPALEFQNNKFDLIYSFSVFSHLSEQAACDWIDELFRILKPGGVLVFTVRDDFFINDLERLSKADVNKSSYEEVIVKAFGDLSAVRHEYKNGKHIFRKTQSSEEIQDIYGDAIIPPDFARTVLGKKFKKHLMLDSDVYRPQAVWGFQK
jgi:ubiquinone/menaquinone biosynthesis C-methylase UbiE